MFLDSDDSITSGSLQALQEAIENTGADYAIGKTEHCTTEGDFISVTNIPSYSSKLHHYNWNSGHHHYVHYCNSKIGKPFKQSTTGILPLCDVTSIVFTKTSLKQKYNHYYRSEPIH